ncbi:TonB-dependent receptor [Biformimicrobium ophioploci]|uniref:TonB-dependent receptor n=1 Tax=Biformimicrobium ophioploci TaxID=3036711 RepID=A0ABQ6LWZ0_9GAMM|nr:TonB-dependent receptor [Microbulbifer sp. NKW57]GMG86578.1 TonB-dependent receptor [Microbulbifer sp. NKW57]
MVPFKKSQLSLLIAAALLPASVAFAQDTSELDCSADAKAKDAALAQQCAEEAGTVEEIYVTATKRASAASDLPMNITAISGEDLREQNITNVKQLIQDSVEISAPDSGARFADSVTVRGLNVSPVSANNLEQFVKSTLAYYIDETPLPKLGFRIKDINRVEKLLGPQGTLYGAGSLGGTIRYITNEPNLEEAEFRVNTSLYQVDGGGLSNDTDFVVNLPVTDTFAIRASAAYLDEAGYIDRAANAPWRTGDDAYISDPNPNKNIYKDDNWQEATTAKIAALWAPTDNLEIKLTHMYQDQLAHGTRGASRLPTSVTDAGKDCATEFCYSNLDFGDFKTPFAYDDRTLISPHEEYADKEFSLDVLDISADLGFATLTSSTSKFEDTSVGEADYTSQGYAYYWWAGFGAGDTNVTAHITFDNAYEGFSHETRLVSAPNDKYEWIVGFYTTEQDSSVAFREIIPTIDQELSWKRVASVTDVGYEEDYSGTYSEDAVFGEFSYNVTDKLTVTAGVRVFQYEDERNTILLDHTYALPDQDLRTKGGEDNKSFFKLNASYDVTDDVLAYATLSQGFRRGGRNNFRDYNGYEVAEDSLSFEPDSIDNFELGLKGYFLDQQLYVQTNVYQMSWNDPQTYRSQAVEFGFPINGTENGPDAETKGWELSSRYKLNDNWSLTYSTATTEGRFTDTLTHCMYKNTGGDTGDFNACRTWTEGDLLGGSPKWKHNLGVSYSGEIAGYPVWGSLRGRYVAETNTDREDTVYESVDTGDVSYVYVPWVRPSYTLFHANAGMRFGDVVAGLWVSNLLNDDPIVSSQSGGYLGRRIFNATPRTVGLSLSYDFQ